MVTKNHGYSRDFFQQITVTNGSFNTDADIVVNLLGGIQGFSLMNETSSTIVQVSYDGTHVHDELNASLVTRFGQWDNRPVDLIWFKISSGGSAVITVRAWSLR